MSTAPPSPLGADAVPERPTGADGFDPLVGGRIVIVVNTDWFFLSHRLPLALAALAAGAEVWVAATDTGRGDEIRAHGLRFVDARMSRTGGNPFRELRSLARLWRLFRRAKPDAVHLIATKAIVYGGLAARAARVRGVVCAVTGAGYALGQNQPVALRTAVLTLLRFVLRRSPVVIFQHEFDRDLYVRRTLVKPTQTVLIRGVGIDPDEWIATAEPSEQVVMLAARLIEEKGIITFVDAARLLRPRFPKARFVLVGPLDLDLPTGITPKRVEGWVETGLVEWWGHSDDMRAVLAQCQIFVLPTYHNEGVPKVLLEAAATERAVVASDIPGCRAVVLEGVTGLLVPPRQPARLAEAVAMLLEDSVLRRRLAAAARIDVAQRFRARDLTEQSLAVYRQVLRGT